MPKLQTFTNHALNVVTALVAVTAVFVGGSRVRQLIAGPPQATSGDPVVVKEWRKYSGDTVRFGSTPALVTIVEFSDFRCPYCKRSAADLQQIRDRYPKEVRFLYRHLPTHPHSRDAALASECGRRQQAFNAYHDVLFAESDSIGEKTWTSFASSSGIRDTSAFLACMQGALVDADVVADSAAAVELQIRGTPTMLINNLMYRGSHGFLQLDSAVQRALRERR